MNRILWLAALSAVALLVAGCGNQQDAAAPGAPAPQASTPPGPAPAATLTAAPGMQLVTLRVEGMT